MNGGANATVFAAFAVGFISFISPCVLPLVPGYLSAISGISFAELKEGKGKAKVLGPALIFCLSFTVMFVALGMGATGIGHWLGEHRVTLRHVSGIVIAAMGVLFIATMFVPRLNREWRPDALMSRAATGGPVVAGLAFAVPRLPRPGPTRGRGGRGRRPGVRGRLAAVHRPDAPRHPPRRRQPVDGRARRRAARVLL